MLLGLIHGALSHARNEQLLGIVGVLILAEPLGASLGRGQPESFGAVWRRLAGGGDARRVALWRGADVPLGPERTGAAFAATFDRVPPDLLAKPV